MKITTHLSRQEYMRLILALSLRSRFIVYIAILVIMIVTGGIMNLATMHSFIPQLVFSSF